LIENKIHFSSSISQKYYFEIKIVTRMIILFYNEV